MSLLVAGATALGGALQGILGYRGQKKTNEANMKLAKYQYSKDLELWNRGNVYNSPEAQMQRLKKAGLNPALVYGQGAVGNASGQLPKYNAPTLDYNYVPPVNETAANTLNQYQDFQVKQAQINNLREQNKVIRETGLIKEAEAKYADEFTFSKLWRTKYQADESRWKSEALGLRENDQSWTNAERQALAKTHLMEGSLPYQLQAQQGKVRLLDRQIDNMLKAGQKLDAQTDYQNKVNEWYLTKMFSQLGLQAVGQISKFVPKPGVSGKGGSFNQKKRMTPDHQYNNANRMKDIWPQP